MNARLPAYILLPFLLLFTATAPAQSPPVHSPAALNFTGYYSFSWRSIPIGSLALEVRESQNGYQSRAMSETRGIAKLLKEHRASASAAGTRTTGRYRPTQFNARYMSGSKRSNVQLLFDPQHRIIRETITPPINHKARPRIAEELKKNIFDPLSGLLHMRQQIYNAHLSGAKQFTFDVFEGKRLMRLHATLAEDLRLKMPDGKRHPALRVTVRRTALGGFKDKELKKMKGGEPLLHFYFSKNERMIPLKVAADIYHGQLQGILRTQCATLEHCISKR